MPSNTSSLARRLGFLSLIFYGVGDILGAGIYALVGRVIDLAGVGAWASFLLAAAVAGLTGLSYAALSARITTSSGAVAFVSHAFSNKWLPTVVGLCVLGTGLTSAATVTSAFSDYLKQLFPLPDMTVQIGLIVLLSLLSFWGILQSSWVNIVFTSVEFLGLVLVVALGFSFFELNIAADFWASNRDAFALSPIFSGVTIAYFAFVGFEDLCNLAEEAKNPAKDIPRAILIALGVAATLYLLVTLTLLFYFPREQIVASKTPLLLVFDKAGWDVFVRYFSIIAMLAIANTGLANLIMASRLLHGMGRESLVPAFLSSVDAKRQTPWVGILVAFGITAFLIITGGVKILAQTTSLLVLSVFSAVHFSLIRLKWSQGQEKFKVPIAVPIIGLVACLALLTQFPWHAFLRSLIFPALGLILWGVQKVRSRT